MRTIRKALSISLARMDLTILNTFHWDSVVEPCAPAFVGPTCPHLIDLVEVKHPGAELGSIQSVPSVPPYRAGRGNGDLSIGV